MFDIALDRPRRSCSSAATPTSPPRPHHRRGADAARRARPVIPPEPASPPLREAIAAKVRERNGAAVHGGSGRGHHRRLRRALHEPAADARAGSELLIPDPGWSNYPAMAHVLNATAVGLSARPGRGMCVDVGCAGGAFITERTRAMIVNSPGNPTGSVESGAEPRDVLEVAARHDLWVISDECYDELIFDGRHTSMASLGHEDRLVTVFTFSKSYAMTGWRVGYVVAPPDFAAPALAPPGAGCLVRIDDFPARGLAALQGPQDCVQEMVGAYRARRDAAGGRARPARGAYVRRRRLLHDGRRLGRRDPDSWAFCRRCSTRPAWRWCQVRRLASAARAMSGYRWRRPDENVIEGASAAGGVHRPPARRRLGRLGAQLARPGRVDCSRMKAAILFAALTPCAPVSSAVPRASVGNLTATVHPIDACSSVTASSCPGANAPERIVLASPSPRIRSGSASPTGPGGSSTMLSARALVGVVEAARRRLERTTWRPHRPRSRSSSRHRGCGRSRSPACTAQGLGRGPTRPPSRRGRAGRARAGSTPRRASSAAAGSQSSRSPPSSCTSTSHVVEPPAIELAAHDRAARASPSRPVAACSPVLRGGPRWQVRARG